MFSDGTVCLITLLGFDISTCPLTLGKLMSGRASYIQCLTCPADKWKINQYWQDFWHKNQEISNLLQQCHVTEIDNVLC